MKAVVDHWIDVIVTAIFTFGVVTAAVLVAKQELNERRARKAAASERQQHLTPANESYLTPSESFGARVLPGDSNSGVVLKFPKTE